MNKSSKIILAIIIVIVLAGVAVILFKPAKSNAPAKDEATTSTSNSSDDTSQSVAATITYDGETFTSSVSSVKSGDFVKVVNASNTDLDFDSDPHPVHTDNPELNAGDIPAGESKTFKLTEKGTWGYHNHLDSSQKGEIEVQ